MKMATNNGEEEVPKDQPEKESMAAGAAGRKPKFPCLRCRKAVAKNSKSVKCNACDQWVHVDCEQISTEMYKIICDPEKFGATGFLWNCQSCMASAVRLEKLVRNLEGSLKEVTDRVTGTESAIGSMNKRVEKLEAAGRSDKEETDRGHRRVEENVISEMEEREAKKLNVVIHKLSECTNERAGGLERMEWDKKGCVNIFRELRMDLEIEDIKFCRRIGDRNAGPRPLVMGLYSEADRSKLLRRAHKLADSNMAEINICPDLTRRQREKEGGMWEEAERRNCALTEEDKAKNLHWAVVGGKGEKRLIKTTARMYQSSERGGFQQRRGGNQAPRGGQQAQRGSQQAHRGSQQAPRGGRVIGGVYRLPSIGSQAQGREDSRYPQPSRSIGDQQHQNSNKRRERSLDEEEMEEDGPPPEKRQQDGPSQSST